MRAPTVSITIVVVASLCLTAVASGQRTLERAEILNIFEELASRPRTTWIPAGTIEATRRQYGAPKITDAATLSAEIENRVRAYQNDTNKRELTEALQKMTLDAIPFNTRYRLANEYTMNSVVAVKYDGDRFHWRIDITSRQDSIVPGAELAGNYMTEQFDVSGNRQRIFAWDGRQYTIYSASGRQATVDAAGVYPRAVNGPLTAGVIPWGHGPYTYAALSAAQTTATEISLDGRAQIQMTIVHAGGSSTEVTLDPSKGYAATASTLPAGGNRVRSNHYSGYRQVAGHWVPSTISVERRDAFSNRLLSSDVWTISSVDATVPAPGSFSVDFNADTFIEYRSPVTERTSKYLYSHSVDTDKLLADRLAYAASEGRGKQNCATAAIAYVASELGRPVPSDMLASLVGPDGQTTMRDMKQLAGALGLFARAVRTDLATLKALAGAKAILHLPGKNHFVVLDSVDDRFVRLIDVSNDTFYYRASVDFFPLEWSEGVALLIGTEPIAGSFAPIGEAALQAIVGDSGWSCTVVLQWWDYEPCGVGCSGWYTFYEKRWGCEPAPSGTCYNRLLVRWSETECYWSAPQQCAVTGEWDDYYMSACN